MTFSRGSGRAIRSVRSHGLVVRHEPVYDLFPKLANVAGESSGSDITRLFSKTHKPSTHLIRLRHVEDILVRMKDQKRGMNSIQLRQRTVVPVAMGIGPGLAPRAMKLCSLSSSP